MKLVPKVRIAIVAVVCACFGVLVGTPANAQTAATITLLHGIPNTPVDVAVGGTVVVPNFQFNTTQDLSSYAGQTLTNVEVRPAGTTTPVISVASLTLPSTGNWTYFAYLKDDGTPAISRVENDTTKTPIGEGRIVILHAAAAPAVDVIIGSDRPIKNFVNGETYTNTLKAGELSGAKIAPTGGDPIADVPTVPIVAGKLLNVFAVGSLKDNTFQFITQSIDIGEQAVTTTAPPTTAAPTTAAPTTAAPTTVSPQLPATGNNETTAMFALAFLLLGVSLLGITRRNAAGRA